MSVPTEAITKERLERWENRLSAAHATPILLVAIGHDHNSGQLVVCTLDEPELDNAKLRVLLMRALTELE